MSGFSSRSSSSSKPGNKKSARTESYIDEEQSHARQQKKKKSAAVVVEQEEDYDNDDYSDDDEGDESESDEDEDEDEEEEEDENWLPRSFYFLAHKLMRSNASLTSEELDKAEKALLKCHTIVIELNPALGKIYKASKTRSNDGKVPPGSNAVARSLADDRYLLCLCCIELSKIAERKLQFTEAVDHLRQAVLWFPRSVQGNFRLAFLLKAFASKQDHLDEAEKLFKKSLQCLNVLIKATKEELAATVSIFDEDESDQAASSSSSSSSSTTTLINANSLADEEKATGELAMEQLILLFCQQDRFEEAEGYMKQKKFTWRLGKQVLAYESAFSPNSSAEGDASSMPFYCCMDNAVSAEKIKHLKHVFRPEAPYWREHDYDSIASNASRKVGYFSYIYPFLERSAKCIVEQTIDEIFQVASKTYPELKKCATIAEWWVHSRPHSSGHQLHFDSDETHIEDGGNPRHPLCTCILFVTANAGGPTIVTDQTLSSNKLATQGYLFYGQENRLVCFEPKYLHGVIPGRGLSPQPGARRLTFMVGFWDRIYCKDRGLDNPGPGQPFPNVEATSWTWPKEMSLESIQTQPTTVSTEVPAQTAVATVPAIPRLIGPVWEPIASASSSATVTKPHYDQCFQGF